MLLEFVRFKLVAPVRYYPAFVRVRAGCFTYKA